MTNSWISLLIQIVLSLSRFLTPSLTFSIFLTLFLPKYQQFSCLKNSQKSLSKKKSNQNVMAKRGSSREGYVEVNWEWFGGVFWAATLKFEHWLRYGFSYLLAPFPRGPLRFKLFISKLRLFPLHVPVTSSQWTLGWVWLLVDLEVYYVFAMNMIMFVYLESYEWQSCFSWNFV